MSINLLEMLQKTAGGALASQASSFLGESKENTEKAVGAILPSLLGSVVGKGATNEGASSLLGMLKDGNHDGGILDNLGGLFGGGDKTSGLMSGGAGILSSLLGSNLGGLVDKIVSMTGLKTGSASSLLKMAAPLVMGVLGRQVMKGGLNAGGLMDLLKGQRGFLKKAMPAGMGGILGLAGNLFDGAKDVVGGTVDAGKKVVGGTVDAGKKVVGGTMDAGKKVVGGAANVAGSAVSGGKSIISRILPWGILLLLLGGLLYWLGIGRGTMDNAMDKVKGAGSAVVEGAKDAGSAVVEGTKDLGNAAVDGVKSAANAAVAAGAKALEGVKFAAGSVGESMHNFMQSGSDEEKVFKFNNLTFATGSANIEGETGAEVDNLGAVLKAYPNMNIEISGHTDNTGDANKNIKLSHMRAGAVKSRLAGLGISAERMNTVGLGSKNPTADNGTAEGRAANRRIEVTIKK